MRIFLGIALLIVVLILAAWLKLRGPDIPFDALEAKYAGADSHFVDLPGGYHVHYRDDGDPALPLLVLLHGFGDSSTSWEGWVRELNSQFHLISIDFPGHGLTRAPQDSQLKAEALADFLDTFAAALELPTFAVAGNSMGGGAAWQLVVRHPQRVHALILLDAAGFPNDKPPGEVPLAFKILRYPIGRTLLSKIDNRPLIEQGLKTDVYDKSLITPFVVDRWAEFQRAPGHRPILMGINLDWGATPTATLLSTIKVPTLILWGENDPLIEPNAAKKFAAAIRVSELIMYPRVGHLPQLEIPQRSASDAAAFLKAHEGAK
ncbi:MAG: alpha/beta hydrolase [Pseudomonadota bacterium]|nr:alpha/beta hydrolase [Pseudomonadota bacterium]